MRTVFDLSIDTLCLSARDGDIAENSWKPVDQPVTSLTAPKNHLETTFWVPFDFSEQVRVHQLSNYLVNFPRQFISLEIANEPNGDPFVPNRFAECD